MDVVLESSTTISMISNTVVFVDIENTIVVYIKVEDIVDTITIGIEGVCGECTAVFVIGGSVAIGINGAPVSV